MFSTKSSRWAGFFCGKLTRFFFPRDIAVTHEGVKTIMVRSLLLPWLPVCQGTGRKEEERMSFRRVASVRHLQGLVWDKVIFETTGGSNNLDVDGLRKRDAKVLIDIVNRNI